MIVLSEELVFKRIYEKYFSRMVVFALSFLGNVAAAEDVVQDVFVKLHSLDNTFQSEAVFSSFLYKMVRNRAIDHLRSGKRIEEMKQRFSEEYSETELMNDELDGELLYFLAESIRQLPPQSKKVIISLYEHDFSYQEAARALDISPSTVKNLRKFALGLLRKRFDSRKLHHFILLTLRFTPGC